MKNAIFFTLLLSTLSYSYIFAQALQSVNPVVGHMGYLVKYQEAPDQYTDEVDLVQSHLEYAEQLLRCRETDQLSSEQQAKRNEVLDHLYDYSQRRLFPVNSAYTDERRPCFVDEYQTVCAVGYLVKQTAGPNLVADINVRYQYATIVEMQLPELNAWAMEHGLSKEELAIIQPAYSPSYKGGTKKLRADVLKRIKFPEGVPDSSYVVVKYTVKKSGRVVDVRSENRGLTNKQAKKFERAMKRLRFTRSKHWRPRKEQAVFVFRDKAKEKEEDGKSKLTHPVDFHAAQPDLDEVIIEGIIIDNHKDPLIAANVVASKNGEILKLGDSYAGTATDYDGKYRLKVPRIHESFDIQVSYTGMKTFTLKEVPFNQQKINITMQERDDLINSFLHFVVYRE